MQEIKNILKEVAVPILTTLVIIAPFFAAILCSNNIDRNDDVLKYINDSLSIRYKIDSITCVDTVYEYENFKSDSIMYELFIFKYNCKLYSLNAFIANSDYRVSDNGEFILESAQYEIQQTEKQIDEYKKKLNSYVKSYNKNDSAYYGFVYRIKFENDSIIYIMKSDSMYVIVPINTEFTYLRWMKNKKYYTV